MYQYEDKELGLIIIKPNPRAKRFIARRKADHVLITVPMGVSSKTIIGVIDEMRPKLRKLVSEPKLLFTEEQQLQTFSFTTKIVRVKLMDSVKMSLKNNILHLYIPDNTEIENPEIQHIIREMIIHAMRHEAKRILIPKTIFFAKKHNLEISDVKISKSITRWGSCSSKKCINLSLFLMLLPEKLIDYVVLHELAHTKEMNHSPKFWSLLDQLCGEDSKALSRKVKNFKSPAKDLLMM